MKYTANEKRYDNMPYRRCGESGLKLPAVSLGLSSLNNNTFSYFNRLAQLCKSAGLTTGDKHLTFVYLV